MQSRRPPPRPSLTKLFLDYVAQLADRLETATARLDQQQQQLAARQAELAVLMRQIASVERRQAGVQAVGVQLTGHFVMSFRVCPTCQTMKPIEHFYRRPRVGNPDARHRQCGDCLMVKQKKVNARRQQPDSATAAALDDAAQGAAAGVAQQRRADDSAGD